MGVKMGITSIQELALPLNSGFILLKTNN